MTEPNQELLADPDVKRIILAGKEWPVPMLAPKHNRIVAPVCVRWIPKLAALAMSSKQEDVFEKLALVVTTEALDEMMNAVHFALLRGHKTLTREELDEMPITVPELTGALPVLQAQTGLFRMVRPGEKPAGEPAGNSRTGAH